MGFSPSDEPVAKEDAIARWHGENAGAAQNLQSKRTGRRFVMREQQNRTGNESAFENMWAAHAFAGAAEHSRQYVEKSLRAFQDETAQLINRRIDHNNAAFAECQNSKDLADLVNAQHKWFADLNRDYYETWIKLSETTQRIIADGASRAAEQSETAAREVKTAAERRQAAQ